jgi:hypothetical protein
MLKVPAPISKIPKAEVRRTKGNSKPVGAKNPFLRCTVKIATAISITIPKAKILVINPNKIKIPPRNSVKEAV